MNLRLLMSAPYGRCSRCQTPFDGDDARTDVCLPCIGQELSNSIGRVLTEEMEKVRVAAKLPGPPLRHIPVERQYQSKLAGYNPTHNSCS